MAFRQGGGRDCSAPHARQSTDDQAGWKTSPCRILLVRRHHAPKPLIHMARSFWINGLSRTSAEGQGSEGPAVPSSPEAVRLLAGRHGVRCSDRWRHHPHGPCPGPDGRGGWRFGPGPRAEGNQALRLKTKSISGYVFNAGHNIDEPRRNRRMARNGASAKADPQGRTTKTTEARWHSARPADHQEDVSGERRISCTSLFSACRNMAVTYRRSS